MKYIPSTNLLSLFSSLPIKTLDDLMVGNRDVNVYFVPHHQSSVMLLPYYLPCPIRANGHQHLNTTLKTPVIYL